jgi:hypothetical protein
MAVLVASRHARLDLDPEPPDTFLPHVFIDGGSTWTSPIARIQKMVPSTLLEALPPITLAEQKLDCLMVLLAVHRSSSMTDFECRDQVGQPRHCPLGRHAEPGVLFLCFC